jgi:hypothetical protein
LSLFCQDLLAVDTDDRSLARKASREISRVPRREDTWLYATSAVVGCVLWQDIVAIVLSATCTGLHGLTTLFSQQAAQCDQINAALFDMCRINGPHCTEEISELDAERLSTATRFR